MQIFPQKAAICQTISAAKTYESGICHAGYRVHMNEPAHKEIPAAARARLNVLRVLR